MLESNVLSEFCALQPLQIDQPIYGTATAEKTVWLLLEYTQSWTARVVENNSLAADVKLWLQQQLKTFPSARLLFIKNNSRSRRGRRFFVGLAEDQEQRLYRFDLTTDSELLSLDIKHILTDPEHYRSRQVTDPQYLVCTNGKRDRCCSKFGLPIYQALQKAVPDPDQVWECSHLGGHRYAAVTAILPAGATYRLMHPGRDVVPFVTATQKGQLWLEGFRGRSCHAPVVQAADYFLRRQTGLLEIDAFTLTSEAASGQNTLVTFREKKRGLIHVIEVKVGKTEPLLSSCNVPKYKVQPQYELVNHTVMRAINH
ncbi:MAG: sucrase ferredoxin [Ardenticatenaceae bacterium]|nr:sucrase ferredoxin [Ardenticatenaceae bacterium]